MLPLFEQEMSHYSPDDPLTDALSEMARLRFSQVVVRDRGHSVLLTEEGVSRWLLSQAAKDVAVGDARIADVLAHEAKNSSQIMSGRQTVRDGVEAFVASLERSEPLQAILVTPTGKAIEEIAGIVTPWDFVSLAVSAI